MSDRISAVALLLALTAGPLYAETARGIVFEDTNGDGQRDAGEPGVPGAVVSNGREVVRTDADGAYRLPIKPGMILFVTKPADYRVPLDGDNLPRFFYIYAPDGTPDELGLRYRGIEPSGSLPESIDFPLQQTERQDRFKAIWFADPQPQTEAEIDYVRDDVVAEVIGTEAAFGITVGDIMYDDLSLLPRYNRIVAQVGVPWYNVPGNHELNFLAPNDRYSLETFKRTFGPPYYSFDYGQVHFVVIDDVHYLGSNAGRSQPNPRGRGNYEGRIDGDQLEWIVNDLRQVDAEKLVVFAMHIPLRSFNTPESASRNVLDVEPFLNAIEHREHALVLHGHMHTAEHHYLGAELGYDRPEPLHQQIIATVSGSWWSGPLDERGIPVTEQRDGTPNGWYVMHVDGTDVRMEFRPAGKPRDFQLRITLDPWFWRHREDGARRYAPGELIRGRITVDQVPSTDIAVNLFNGGPRSTVTYRIGDREAVAMEHTRRVDPFVEDLFIHHGETMKSWVSTEPSSHVFVAPLPDDLGPGVHTIEVEAQDDWGQRHRSRLVFEVSTLESH